MYKRGHRLAKVFFIVSIAMIFSAAALLNLTVGYEFTAILFIGIALVSLAYGCLLLLCHSERAGAVTRLLEAMTIILSLVIAFFTSAMSLISWTEELPPEKAEYAFIYGAAVFGKSPSRVLRQRIEAAIAYYELYPDTVFIASGGQGEGDSASEAEVIKRGLISAGVEESQILLEEKAASSRENTDYSLALLEAADAAYEGKIAVISSEFHCYRLRLLLSERGRESVAVPAVTRPWVLKQNYIFREVFALAGEVLGLTG